MPDAGPSSSLSHPLEVGARALCSRGEDERPEVEVIERRSKDGDLPQYYVHFVGQDRRLDECVDAARLGGRFVGSSTTALSYNVWASSDATPTAGSSDGSSGSKRRSSGSVWGAACRLWRGGGAVLFIPPRGGARRRRGAGGGPGRGRRGGGGRRGASRDLSLIHI